MAEFQKGLLGIVIESRFDAIAPEHVLAGLIRLPDSFARRKIKQQQLRPENVMEVLKSCVENQDNRLPPITSLDNAPLTPKLEEAAQNLADWLSNQKDGKKLKERDFLALVVSAIGNDTIEALADFAQMDWEAFKGNLSWPPKASESAIKLWDDKTSNLAVATAFDKSGKKLISALEAEIEGLGLREYTVEALFISLLNLEPSVLDLAIRAQLTSKDSYIVSSKDLSLELRNRIRKPRMIKEREEISPNNCQDRLITIFEAAAEIAGNEEREKISAKDMTEALTRCETKGRLGNLLKAFGIDLGKVSDFLETYTEEAEEEETLVPITQLEQKIKEQIIGQNHAVARILPFIKRLRFGYRRPGKPAGVFLFLGPSGTGKTQMAKALAEILYGSEDDMLMLEMGQFGTKETKSMFIGAAPGYVGYGEGKLTNGLRDKPESVVLFDEVEKADPLVLDVLLRFLDEGKIDDPAGPVRDGSKCLIVLTSNFLADSLHIYEEKIKSSDKATQEKLYRDLRNELLKVGEKVQDEKIKKFFRPEFIFRIDEIILFRSFDLEDYEKIAEISLDREIAYLKKNYDYEVTCDRRPIVEKIAKDSVERSNEGARVINRLVNVFVVNPIIDFLTAYPDDEFQSLHLAYDESAEQIKIIGKP